MRRLRRDRRESSAAFTVGKEPLAAVSSLSPTGSVPSRRKQGSCTRTRYWCPRLQLLAVRVRWISAGETLHQLVESEGGYVVPVGGGPTSVGRDDEDLVSAHGPT